MGGDAEPKGKTLEETQRRREGPDTPWEKGTVWGERGLGAGLAPRAKVDFPLDMPEDMAPGQRSEYLADLHCLPSPVVLVTTVDRAGNVDCSPKNWCMPAGAYGFAFVCSTDHDAFMNIQTTGEFVVNVPGVELVDRLHALARRGAASWENELARAGLTAVPSRVVRPPRVDECRVHLECRAELLHEVSSARELKSAKVGTDVLIVGKVVAASADAEVVRAPSYEDRLARIRPFVLTPLWNYTLVERGERLPHAWDLEY